MMKVSARSNMLPLRANALNSVQTDRSVVVSCPVIEVPLSLTECAPRQAWIPKPKDRCRVNDRSSWNWSGWGNQVGSRLAAPVSGMTRALFVDQSAEPIAAEEGRAGMRLRAGANRRSCANRTGHSDGFDIRLCY